MDHQIQWLDVQGNDLSYRELADLAWNYWHVIGLANQAIEDGTLQASTGVKDVIQTAHCFPETPHVIPDWEEADAMGG